MTRNLPDGSRAPPVEPLSDAVIGTILAKTVDYTASFPMGQQVEDLAAGYRQLRTFAEFVARHSAPCRRDSLSDAEFRSIVENHPVVRDLLATGIGAG